MEKRLRRYEASKDWSVGSPGLDFLTRLRALILSPPASPLRS